MCTSVSVIQIGDILASDSGVREVFTHIFASKAQIFAALQLCGIASVTAPPPHKKQDLACRSPGTSGGVINPMAYEDLDDTTQYVYLITMRVHITLHQKNIGRGSWVKRRWVKMDVDFPRLVFLVTALLGNL